MRNIHSRMTHKKNPQGNYATTDISRRVSKTWRPSRGNSDKLDLPHLQTMRDQSRDAERRQPLATSAIRVMNTNVVGMGLVLQSQPKHEIIGISEEEASVWSRNTEFEFSQMWASSKNCDTERTKNFDEIQSVAFRSALLDGDICAILPNINRGSKHTLTVKLIEADLLSNPNNKTDSENIAGGVEIDSLGEHVAYHFSKSNPNGINSRVKEWVRIPTYGKKSKRLNVIHLSKKKRAGQRRGIPFMISVLESMKVLSEYTSAELESALVSGLFATFITSKGNEPLDPYKGDPEDSGLITADGNREINLTPGMIMELAEGESIETSNPGRPNTAFDAFTTSILKQIGAGLGISYEVLLGHFSASYSASRAALLEAWKEFRMWRKWFAQNFTQIIYEEWLFQAVLRGDIIAPNFLSDERVRKAYSMTEWVGSQPGQLDPEKETRSAIMKIEAGLSTRTKEANEMNGTDFETNAKKAIRENELLVEGGLKEIDNSAMRGAGNE